MSLVLNQAGIPGVNNLTLTNANTEYSYSFNQYTKKFLIQARGDHDIKLAFFSGESATDYFTIKTSCVYYEDLVHGPFTIYMQSPDAGTVVEIIEWTNRP